jgi:carbonic anhydrase/acetyltransferase-like protein (isoleucine patch superfamily)
MIMEFNGKVPKLDGTVFVADSALVIGDVEIGARSNIWFNTIVRGDVNIIRIGSDVTIQDACVLHVERLLPPLTIEDGVALGHRAVVHGCRVKRGSLIGIGAIVLDGAEIGEESIVGAGAVVTPNTIIPPRTLALGTPAKPVRPLDERDLQMIRRTIGNYQDLKEIYGRKKGNSSTTQG